MDSEKPKGPLIDFTDQDKQALIDRIEADQTPDKSSLDVDMIILFCQENPKDVFEEKLIGTLAMMTPADRGKVKTALKGKISARDFDSAIKDAQKRAGLLRVASPNESGPRITDTLSTSPLDATVPAGWQITDEGIFEWVTKVGESGYANTTKEKRFPAPVVLAAALTPLDSQDETCAYEVAWLLGSWHRIALDAAAIFDRARLTGAANFGLPVDSENSKGLLRWLAALRDTREIPSKKVVTRCGWHGKKLMALGSLIVAAIDEYAEANTST